MSDKEELILFALSSFQPLVDEYGFKEPVVENNGFMTTVDYLNSDLGIELELDWREFAFFVLVVRLEDGKLPGGYYVSSGKKCRKHLSRVLGECGLVERNANDIKAMKTKQDFENQVIEYRKLLLAHISALSRTDVRDLFA